MPSSPDVTTIRSAILGHSRGDASSAVTSQKRDGVAIRGHADALRVHVCGTLRAELSVPPGRAAYGTAPLLQVAVTPDANETEMDLPRGRGRALRLKDSSPFPASLSFVPSPCASDSLGPEERAHRVPRFPPAFLGLLPVHTRCRTGLVV